MSSTEAAERIRVADIIERYGKCLELVPMDPHFHDITVGLYVKDGTCTVWTFSKIPGAQDRLGQIRDQMVALGGLLPLAETRNQLEFPCGYMHLRPLKFLVTQAVGRSPDYRPASDELSIQDTKTKLMLKVFGSQGPGSWVYRVSGEGEAPNGPMRLKAVVAGFVRYGEMQKTDEEEVAFPCGQRHDQLLRVLLPYSRNVSSVENMMAEEALWGQMTTGTLGFTPT